MDPEDQPTDGNDDPQKLVPLKAVEEQREARERESARAEKAERELAEARGYERGRQETEAAQPAQDPPKELSPAELQQAVDEQRMTAAEAEAIRDRQMERRVEAKVSKRVEQQTEVQAIANRTSAELDRYTKAIPALGDQSSAEFEKVKGEFNYQVSLGMPADKRTELLAVRAAFGDVSKLEKIGDPAPPESHQETGGGRDPGADGARSDSWPKDMPAKHRKYYDSQINKGILADRKAAVKEWSYKPKHNPRYAA